MRIAVIIWWGFLVVLMSQGRQMSQVLICLNEFESLPASRVLRFGAELSAELD